MTSPQEFSGTKSLTARIEERATADGRPLRCHVWDPTGAIRARVLFLHGIESHPQWFAGTCHWLARLGFQVTALQRRGSGDDRQDRGDVSKYSAWLQDVEQIGRSLLAAKPSVGVHLLGVSWGGKLACASALVPEPWMTSLILISPGLQPRVDVPWWTKLRIAWACITNPGRKFSLPIGRPAMFTANERWKKFIQDDPLRLQEVTARFLHENVKLDRYLRKNEARVRVPVLLLLAQTDEIIDQEKTKARLARFGSERKKVMEYPGFVHTLEFEENPDVWRKDVLSWLDSF